MGFGGRALRRASDHALRRRDTRRCSPRSPIRRSSLFARRRSRPALRARRRRRRVAQRDATTVATWRRASRAGSRRSASRSSRASRAVSTRAAHEAALEGPGGTIAVLGCGLDVDYPRENARAQAGDPRGAASSSRSSRRATSPGRRTFRSATASSRGSASGVVVVEASRRSGSLITARLAADFGRDVFAVPGSVFSETSAGTHELLRDGAILCRGVEDVFAELFPTLGAPAAAPRRRTRPLRGRSRPRRAALFEVAAAPRADASAEELVRATDLPAAVVLAALFELEDAGLASESEGRYGCCRVEAGGQDASGAACLKDLGAGNGARVRGRVRRRRGLRFPRRCGRFHRPR